VAQLVARVVWDHEARGSSPRTPTNFPQKTAFSGGFSVFIVTVCGVLTQVDFHKMGQKNCFGGGASPPPKRVLTQILTQTGIRTESGGEFRAGLE
jgi:hypothetical protein